jgi:hypothetical protein
LSGRQVGSGTFDDERLILMGMAIKNGIDAVISRKASDGLIGP